MTNQIKNKEFVLYLTKNYELVLKDILNINTSIWSQLLFYFTSENTLENIKIKYYLEIFLCYILFSIYFIIQYIKEVGF